MAEAQQVSGRREPAAPVRRPDRWRVMEGFAGRVDDDERDPARLELRPQGVAQVREHGDQSERPPFQDALDPAATRGPPPVQLGDDDGEVVLPGHLLDAHHDLECPFALELVEDQLEELGSTRRPAWSLVAPVEDDRLDPASGLGGHVRSPVDHLRDRRDGDAGLVRDLGDGDPSRSTRPYRRDRLHGAIIPKLSLVEQPRRARSGLDGRTTRTYSAPESRRALVRNFR